jgi:hypothetical protein
MPSSGEPYDDQEFRPNRRTRPARDAGLLLVDLAAGKPLCRDLLWRELNPRGRRGGGSCLTRPDVPSHENGAEDQQPQWTRFPMEPGPTASQCGCLAAGRRLEHLQ